MKKKWILGITAVASLILLGACEDSSSQTNDLREGLTSGSTEETTTSSEETTTSSSGPILPSSTGEYSFFADDGTELSVETPGDWSMYEDPEELGSGVNASFTQDDNAYASIMMFSALDFESFETFEEALKEEFEIPEDAEVTPAETTEFSGNSYIFEETDGLYIIKYDIYIMQNENYFMVAQTWGQPSGFDDSSDALKEMVESVRFR